MTRKQIMDAARKPSMGILPKFGNRIRLNSTSLRHYLAVGVLAGLLIPATEATLTPIDPFQSAWSESWEAYNNYTHGQRYLDALSPIMAGTATIENPLMAIYQPDVDADFGLGTSGNAQAWDGQKGMGLDGASQQATIRFQNPVNAFGAYWGATTRSGSGLVSLSFSDGSTTSFSYRRGGDGALEWHGWFSTAGITSITFAGNFVVIDGLRALAVSAATAVPEPSTWIGSLTALAGLGWTLRRRK